MMFRERIDKKTEKLIAAKIEEAMGLLGLVKPLSKKAGKLTDAEQAMFLETVAKANKLLNEAWELEWEDRQRPDTSTALRLG